MKVTKRLSLLLFLLGLLISNSMQAQIITGERCFVSPTKPSIVSAKATWTVNQGAGTVTIRVQFSKTFVDNTYGTNAIGWPSGHKFSDLTGSDKLSWALKDANGTTKLAFAQDYISASTLPGDPSGYGTLGFNGDGDPPTIGSPTDVLAFNTSLDQNFNAYGYVLTTNSPATDANYTPNPTYPNWIYDVWYEVTVKLSTFGAAGFGYPDIVSVHASPSKTGNNTEAVTPTNCLISLGDKVWHDLNGNGIQDTGEPGISGVTVTLIKPDATTQTTVTNSNGDYLFTGLDPYVKYSLQFPTSLPLGFTLTLKDQGTNNSVDSDPLQTTGLETNISLYPGQTDLTHDAGYVQNILNLGNLIYYDNNRSGTFDAGDDPVVGTTVRLYADVNNDNIPDGSPIMTTTTDANGIYAFNNLNPGNYIVGAVLPTGYAIVPTNGGDPDNNIDNDNNGITISGNEARGYAITLVAGTEPTGGITNNTYDIGIYNPAAPLTGGQKCFASPTKPNIVSAIATWSANQSAGTITIRVTFSKTFVDNTYGTSAIGWPSGHKFSDLTGSDKLGWVLKDANGITKLAFGQDYISASTLPSDPSGYGTLGFGGDGNNPTVGSASDVLAFNSSLDVNFNAYNYVLTVNSPVTNSSYAPNPTYPNWIYDVWYEVTVKASAFGAAGFGYPEIASVHASPSKTGNNTEVVNPVPCSVSSIGDKVWNDMDFDGIQDAGELGLPNVTVKLFDCSNNLKGTTTTDINGNYLFANLVPGDYYVVFVLPSGYSYSPKDQGGNDATDSDADVITGKTACTNLAANENDMTWDAGMYVPPVIPASVGDRVWIDKDKDGIQDAGEPGIHNVLVKLYTCADVLIAQTTTDVDGNYLFSNIPPGSYYVMFELPDGYEFSPKDAGGNDATDSDADIVTGKTACFTLNQGDNNMTIDAGLKELPSEIGNKVWHDLDQDGIQDAGEPGLQNVTVKLYDCTDNLIATTTTDANGNYLFSNIPPGNYYVQFVPLTGYTLSPKDQGGNDALDSDPSPATGKTDCITLTAGENNTTVDAGLQILPVEIGDKVWNDIDNDGIQDAGEPGLPNVTVKLYDCLNNLMATTTTDANGNYLFTGLQPGGFYVKFELPTGYIFSPKDQGGDDAKDTDADIATGKTECFTLTPGSSDMTKDAGMTLCNCSPASLGDKVWLDTDKDGIQDAGENGIQNVTVKLYTCAGVLVSTITTDANGKYLFTSLAAGSYYVEFVLPSGYMFSPKDQGADDSLDSDPSMANGKTSCYTLAAGDSNMTVDAGMYPIPPTSVGDKVWLDTDNDGIQDAGEPGIPNVTVKLYTCADVLVSTVTTNSNGIYTFTNVPPGSYYVQFILPNGYTFTQKDQGSDDALDSDPNPMTGKTDCFTVNLGDVITTVDAGLNQIPPVTIGDKVWLDLDDDGIQDAGEPGLVNVTVKLYDCTDVLIATTTTDVNGNYSFTNIPAGSYYVQFVLPNGYTFTLKDQGGNDALDSDADVATGKTPCITLNPGAVNTTIDAGMKIMTDPNPDITKTDYKTFMPAPGQTTTYVINYTNSGAAPLFNVVIKDAIPLGTSYVSSTGGTFSNDTVFFTIGTLNPSQSGQVAVTVLVDSFFSDYTNDVFITGLGGCCMLTVYADSAKDVNIGDTTSTGGGGGIESIGDMAELILKRRINIQNGEITSVRSFMKSAFSPAATLKDIVPLYGPFNSVAQDVTPFDIASVSNATSSFAVDYVANVDAQTRRVAGIFSATTNAPKIYDHTKQVCDRLNEFELLENKFITVRGYNFYNAKLRNIENKYTDNSVSFAVYETYSGFIVESKWTYNEYNVPATATNVYNFQVWSSTADGTKDLVGKIIDKFKQLGSVSFVTNDQYAPEVYFSRGSYYHNGILTLKLINSGNPQELSIRMDYRVSQGAQLSQKFQTLTINKGINEVNLPIGIIADAKLYLTASNGFKDELFVSGGSYAYFTGQNTSVTNFITDKYSQASTSYYPEGTLVLAGGFEAKGNLGDYMNVFRSLKGNSTAYDLSNYDKIKFSARGAGKLTVFIEMNDTKNFNFFAKTISLNGSSSNYELNFKDFKPRFGGSIPFNAKNIEKIAFSYEKGNNPSVSSFDLEVKDIVFLKKTGSSNGNINEIPDDYVLSQNYPNPFNPTTTINYYVGQSGNISVKVFDLLGREVAVLVDNEYRAQGNYSVRFEPNNLSAGVYMYELRNADGTVRLMNKMIFLK